MKKHSTSHWTLSKDNEGLLFFAQRLDELLFDYTIDTYKPFVLNTQLLCKEVLHVLEIVERGVIDKQNLSHILEELNWSYSSDIIAKSLLGNENIYLPIKDLHNIEEVKLRLQLLDHKLSRQHYIEKNVSLLSESIINNEKKNIDRLTSILITSLKATGYSQVFLYKTVRETFFNTSNKIIDFSILTTFFQKVLTKKSTYEILFRANKIFLEFKNSCEGFNVFIIQNPPSYFNAPVLGTEEIFILCKDIDARDYQHARLRAEKLIAKLSNIFVFFHHKNKPAYNALAFVYNTDDKKMELSYEPRSPMEKGFDLRPQKATKELTILLKRLKFEKESFLKIDKAIDLHSIAVGTQNVENQILSVWIGFETVIPNSESKGKLQQVLDSLIPILCLRYLTVILNDLVKSLLLWNRQAVNSELNIKKGENLREKMYLLILAEDLEEQRKNLYALMDDFPLLRFRLFQLNNTLNTSGKIHNYISAHAQKVSWQIRRIYRTRNMIIHSGRTYGNTDLLVENAHAYFDHLLSYIIDSNIKNDEISTIEQGIKLAHLRWAKSENQLNTDSDIKINSGNIKDYIF